MPLISPEQLKKISELYKKHLDHIPQGIIDIEPYVYLSNQNNFDISQYNYVAINLSFVPKNFAQQLFIIAGHLAPAAPVFLGKKNYNTAAHLILDEFIKWYISFSNFKPNPSQELVVVERRLNLLRALFVKEQFFTLTEEQKKCCDLVLIGFERHLTLRKRQMDIFNVVALVITEFGELNTLASDFTQLLRQLSAPSYALCLQKNFQDVRNELITDFKTLEELFNEHRELNGLIWRSEQSRLEIMIQVERITRGIKTIRNEFHNMFYYSIENGKLFTYSEKANEIYEKLNPILGKNNLKGTLITTLDVLKWHVGTEEGRIFNLSKLPPSHFDLHVLQNPLTSELQTYVEEHFNPPLFSSAP